LRHAHHLEGGVDTSGHHRPHCVDDPTRRRVDGIGHAHLRQPNFSGFVSTATIVVAPA
jgi:hypothetical protein